MYTVPYVQSFLNSGVTIYPLNGRYLSLLCVLIVTIDRKKLVCMCMIAHFLPQIPLVPLKLRCRL